jgi:hypothetical protein
MDATRLIQIAVARADLLLCQLLALPWKRMAVSLLLAWLLIHVVKAVIKNER